MVFESIVRLAELRRRQGRAEAATELCERIAWHPAAQLCLAEIALDRGDAVVARDLVARHLRALPAGERLGRAPGLELAVRADLAFGGHAAAATGVEELDAARGRRPAPRSCARRRGTRAGSPPPPAATRRRPGGELEDAVDLWSRMRAPYELARGHIALAELAFAERPPRTGGERAGAGARCAPGPRGVRPARACRGAAGARRRPGRALDPPTARDARTSRPSRPSAGPPRGRSSVPARSARTPRGRGGTARSAAPRTAPR